MKIACLPGAAGLVVAAVVAAAADEIESVAVAVAVGALGGGSPLATQQWRCAAVQRECTSRMCIWIE